MKAAQLHQRGRLGQRQTLREVFLDMVAHEPRLLRRQLAGPGRRHPGPALQAIELHGRQQAQRLQVEHIRRPRHAEQTLHLPQRRTQRDVLEI
jgi:hypothetical protein